MNWGKEKDVQMMCDAPVASSRMITFEFLTIARAKLTNERCRHQNLSIPQTRLSVEAAYLSNRKIRPARLDFRVQRQPPLAPGLFITRTSRSDSLGLGYLEIKT